MDELIELRQRIERDPKSADTVKDSIYIYNKKARRHLDDIAWAIRLKMLNGRVVPNQ